MPPRPGVKIEDLSPGAGPAATRQHEIRITYKLFLHRGECIQDIQHYWIDLRRRETIAGLRYGLEGMQVGATRRITVPPHLAYGADGVPGRVPPNALLIFEVQALDLRPSRPSARKQTREP
jgi:FKBP-type peptidyl-prolyl cis-trans isomerase